MRVFVLVLASIFSFQANALTTDKKIYIGLGVTAAAIIAAGVGWYIYDTNKIKEQRFMPQERTDADKKMDQNLARIKQAEGENIRLRLEQTESAYKNFAKELVAKDTKIPEKDKNKFEKALNNYGKAYHYGYSDSIRTRKDTHKILSILHSVAKEFYFDKKEERLKEFVENAVSIYSKHLGRI